MKRTPWSEVLADPACYHLLVGCLHDSFAGGPDGQYDTNRLRFAVNLMMRCCTGLALGGSFAVQGSRAGGEPQVQVALSGSEDFVRLRTLTGGHPAELPPWKAGGSFVLRDTLHARLLLFAGPPDERGAGRRARERAAAESEERSLRWKVSARGGWG